MNISLKFDSDRDGSGFDIIQRAACILDSAGENDKAKRICQRASVRGYDFYDALKLVKEFGFNTGA